jgi:hypothetical protein
VLHHYPTTYQTPGHKASTRDAIKLLLQHGATWKPDPSTLNATRRIPYRIKPDVTVELIGLLLKNENGEVGVQELLLVPRLCQHLAGCQRQLARLRVTLDGYRTAETEKGVRPEPAPWMLRFDRHKLYEEIWSEPAERVAARYRVSGAAIAKVCRCLRIPKPSRGYWGKKTAGQRTARRPKLPHLHPRTWTSNAARECERLALQHEYSRRNGTTWALGERGHIPPTLHFGCHLGCESIAGFERTRPACSHGPRDGSLPVNPVAKPQGCQHQSRCYPQLDCSTLHDHL